ncbi:MAG TPA: Cro/CI family transcriptional regulator [Methylophilaceae bacterium]|nr:Cro/CI family transcriptional regulator [Methylophilaceae bacterium]
MTTQEAIDWAGGLRKLAKKLGMRAASSICGWGIYPPMGRQYQLQVITKGKLKAEKPAEE